VWVLALSTTACFLDPTGFSELPRYVITGTALLAAIAVLAWMFGTHRPATVDDEPPLPVGAAPP
jgi:hypothetical protein